MDCEFASRTRLCVFARRLRPNEDLAVQIQRDGFVLGVVAG